MDKQLINLLLIYLITGFFIIVTIFVRTYMKKDFVFMKFKPFNITCNFWCISHFLIYLLLGYYAPKYWYLSFTLSILWEYCEVYLEKHNVYISSNVINDIITNSLGLVTGIVLSLNKI